MMLEINTHQLLSKLVNSSTTLSEFLEQAQSLCQRCGTISPLVCVERCELWKAKNELLEMNGVLTRNDHVPNLFNAVKNKRRLKIMDALSERPRNVKDLQEYLKNSGYYHSCRTINEYLRPLVQTGLIKEDGDGRYRSTLYGRKFRDMLSKFDSEDLLPTHSHGHEENILKQLLSGPKSYEELAVAITHKSLSRAMKRLLEKGLITKSQASDYVFYFKTKKGPNVKFSPTEKKVFETIPEVGIPARNLSREVNINVRRTYKYLRRLREKKLVFAQAKPKIYELTPSGKEIASLLEEITNYALSASRVSGMILQQARQANSN